MALSECVARGMCIHLYVEVKMKRLNHAFLIYIQLLTKEIDLSRPLRR